MDKIGKASCRPAPLWSGKNMSVFANQPTVHSGEVGSQAIGYLTECHPTFLPSDIRPPRHVVTKTFGHAYILLPKQFGTKHWCGLEQLRVVGIRPYHQGTGRIR